MTRPIPPPLAFLAGTTATAPITNSFIRNDFEFRIQSRNQQLSYPRLLSILLSSMETPTPVNSNPDVVVFEPVLNVPALITFVFVAIVFGALISRTLQVEEAVQVRREALSKLRSIKSQELGGTVTPEQVQLALQQFEQAVENEESLRTIIPGVVRIVPPGNVAKEEKDAVLAAKQFLGKDYDLITNPQRISDSDDDDGRIGTVNTDTNRQLSPIAITILVVLFISQLALLAFLSMDPMSNGMP